MLAIYKRELKSYFRSFIGFLFIAVTLFFLGLYFSVYNLMNGYPYFAYVVSSVTFLFMLTVPILTMRILAEEKRSKTDQLILTAPVSVGGIVMGKFLALLTIFAIPVAIICFYPLIMAQYGSVPMGEAYLSILAYCHRSVPVFRDREPGHCSSTYFFSIVPGIYDGFHLLHYFQHRQSVDKAATLL